MNEAAHFPCEEKNDHGEEKKVVSVFLTCISCGKVEEIHVFRDRGLPRKVYWACLDCQKNGNCSDIRRGNIGRRPCGGF